MINYKSISNIDKSAINFLNQFENQFIEETKNILISEEFKHLKVSYSLSVVSPDNSGKVFRVESNACLSLENSTQFVSKIVDYFNSRSKELSVFLSSESQLLAKIQLERKAIVESESDSDSDELNKSGEITYLPIEPRYSFDQIILPNEVKEEIFNALNIIEYQNLIYKEWGFEEIDPIPKSVLNFYGPPGTGKTMCAHAIAKKLGLKLLALNYAEIESKYVGDAAKNLSAAFETAKRNNCVMFFDEADSFLGKRIRNVTQGADQALNSLRSQMLILLEEFSGVVIFATNLVSNFDQAFESRILKHILFPLPNEDARIAIIKKTIPPRLPLFPCLSDDDLRKLSIIIEGFSGREIKGVILECMLNKVAIDGAHSNFKFEDFETAFTKKKESLKKLQEEKDRDKREKIFNAIKNGNVNKDGLEEQTSNEINCCNYDSKSSDDNPENNKTVEMNDKNKKLICLVSELGVFFGKCDGCYDDSEKSFVDNYLNTLGEKYLIAESELLEIKKSVNESESLDKLIAKTNSYAELLSTEERIPLKRTLSYFIYHLIRADGVIHANEIKCYKEWKDGVNIDDNINIEPYKVE